MSEILDRHEAQINRMQRLDVTVSSFSQGSVGRQRFIITPELKTSTRVAGAPRHFWWDGKRTGDRPGFDPWDTEKSQTKTSRRHVSLYRNDIPMCRFFQPFALRSYRTWNDEPDLSLRQLCEHPSAHATVNSVDGLIRIRTTHPGVAKPSRSEPASKGSIIEVILDPAFDDAVRSYHTTIKSDDGGTEYVVSADVNDFQHFGDAVFLPTEVRHVIEQLGEAGDRYESSHRFEYHSVNQPIDTSRLKFGANQLVTEFESQGDNNPQAYYVTDESGELGEALESEAIANEVAADRLGFAKDGRNLWWMLIAAAFFAAGVVAVFQLFTQRPSWRYVVPVILLVAAGVLKTMYTRSGTSLDQRITYLQEGPREGDRIDRLVAMDATTNQLREIDLTGRVSIVEFWATWCPPCQGTMQKLDQLAAENREEWKDKVQVITVRVDEDFDAAREHLATRGWKNTIALLDRPLDSDATSLPSRNSTLARDHRIDGVPTCLIIDDTGTIVYRGAAQLIDIEEMVNRFISSR